MSGQWTISEIQLPLGFYIQEQRIEIPFQHNYFLVRDETGAIVREINGLAIGTDGSPLTVGTFGEPLRVVIGPRFGDQRGINETVLLEAPREEMEIRLRAVDICAQQIEDNNVTYQVTGRNSNSIASTVAACLGLVEPQSFIGTSTPGANNLLIPPSAIVRAQLDAGFSDGNGISDNRCFTAETLILMGDGSTKPISDIIPNDIVAAFDTISTSSDLRPRKVARIFRSKSKYLIDLRGVRCTPGHVFMSTGQYSNEIVFSKISEILLNDGTIVDHTGLVIRARTGAEVGSPEDTIFKIYLSQGLNNQPDAVGCNIYVRGGIPVPTKTNLVGSVDTSSQCLTELLQEAGFNTSNDGTLIDLDGNRYTSCNWPTGSTPFDMPGSENWIVGIDNQHYIPRWIINAHEQDIETISYIGDNYHLEHDRSCV